MRGQIVSDDLRFIDRARSAARGLKRVRRIHRKRPRVLYKARAWEWHERSNKIGFIAHQLFAKTQDRAFMKISLSNLPQLSIKKLKMFGFGKLTAYVSIRTSARASLRASDPHGQDRFIFRHCPRLTAVNAMLMVWFMSSPEDLFCNAASIAHDSVMLYHGKSARGLRPVPDNST
jgi:hypothetical protein